jgi:hypothetical protein
MAHFAQLDENGFVVNVIVVDNDKINNLPFPESESIGISFCQSLFGVETIWKQTSYSHSFRNHYAWIGGLYDFDRDIFVPPAPYEDMTYNKVTGVWTDPKTVQAQQIIETYKDDLMTDNEILTQMQTMKDQP